MIKEKSIKGECPSCASTQFVAIEKIILTGSLDDDGTLLLKGGDTDGIDLIACENCGKEVNQEHFKSIEFC